MMGPPVAALIDATLGGIAGLAAPLVAGAFARYYETRLSRL
jgi:hypothetical protein